MSEHLPESSNEKHGSPKPHFEFAKPLDHNPDPKAPRYEIQDQPVETLPVLTSEQLKLMGDLKPEEWTSETLDSLGLPVGEGITAVSVDGEKRYVNIGLEDYGVTVIADRMKLIPIAEQEESVEKGETLSVEATKELGHDALEAAGISGTEASEASVESAEGETIDLKHELATELIPDTETVDRFMRELERTDGDQYLRRNRQEAAQALDLVVRSALNGESPLSRHAIEPLLEDFLRIGGAMHEAKNYVPQGDSIYQLASRVHAAAERVEGMAVEYFKDHDASQEGELVHDIQTVRVHQSEMSSLMREQLAGLVDGIDSDDRTVGDALSELNRIAIYTDNLNDEHTLNSLFRATQNLTEAIRESDEKRYKIDDTVAEVKRHSDELKLIIEKFARA